MRTKKGDPTKSDTARVVNASQAQIQQLIDAGYLPYKSEEIRSRQVRDSKKVEADRGFFASDDIDVDDLFDAALNKPYLFFDIVQWGIASPVPKDKLSIPSGFFPKYIKEVDKILKDLLPREGDASYGEYEEHKLDGGISSGAFQKVDRNLSDLEKKKKALSKALEEGKTGTAIEIAGGIGQNLKGIAELVGEREYEESYKRYVDEEPNERITKYFQDLRDLQNKQKEYRKKANEAGLDGYKIEGDIDDLVTLDFASPGLADPDEAIDLYKQGFEYPERVGEFSILDKVAAGLKTGTQIPKALYNQAVLAGVRKEQQAVRDSARAAAPPVGDLGDSTKVTLPQVNPDDLYKTERYDPTGKLTRIENIYPTKKTVHGPYRTVRNFQRDITDQKEDLGNNFYLDRERAGTGSVTNEELVKTLFNKKIVPNRKIQFYNKELKDLVDVFLYDDPEMLEKAGVKESIIPQNFRSNYSLMLDDLVDQQNQQDEPASTTEEAPQEEATRPQNINPLASLAAKQLPTSRPTLANPSQMRLPTGRRVVRVGAADQSREGSRTGQKLDREYYYDPKAKQYKERAVDAERKGGPVYGGTYSFAKGGRISKRK